MAMPRLLFYIAFVTVNIDIVGCNCSFPSYTNRYPRWETRISFERRVIGAYWIFNQTTAEFIELSKSQASYKYSCDVAVSSDTFLMKLNLEGINKEQSLESGNKEELMIFMCVQFYEHSDSVLQLKSSPLSLLAPKEILCRGSRSSWDNQLLMWPRKKNYDVCPITGGYQFFMTDPLTGTKLCANSYLPPVLESECREEEGIYIDFRNFFCRGSLGMQLNQWLSCLGSWTEGNFTFSVVTDHDETWPRVWLFRFPLNMQGDSFQAEIFKDTNIFTTENIDPSTDYYILQMTKKSFPSTCEDEATQCHNCSSGSTAVYCQKTCDACLSQEQCNFTNNNFGNWVQFSISGTQNVTVSTSEVTVGRTSYSCLNVGTKSWYITKDRRPLTITFSNGCRPRYLCVDVVRKSDSVLQYRLSQEVSWSNAPPTTANDICSDNLFADSKTSPATTPFQHKYKVIVKQDEPRQKVSCGLGRGHFHLMAHFQSGKNCKMLIDLCDLETSFHLAVSKNCGNNLVLGTEQNCLATFRDETNGDLVVVTEDVDTRIAYCWFMHKDEWESRPKLFLTYAADCNSDTARYILYRNYTGYLAYFDMAAGPGLFGTYSCSEDNTFLLNTSITSENNNTMEGSTSSLTTPTVHRKSENVKENVYAPINYPSQAKRNQGQQPMPTIYVFVLFSIMLCAL